MAESDIYTPEYLASIREEQERVRKNAKSLIPWVRREAEETLVMWYEANLQNAIDNGAPTPAWPLDRITAEQYYKRYNERYKD